MQQITEPICIQIENTTEFPAYKKFYSVTIFDAINCAFNSNPAFNPHFKFSNAIGDISNVRYEHILRYLLSNTIEISKIYAQEVKGIFPVYRIDEKEGKYKGIKEDWSICGDYDRRTVWFPFSDQQVRQDCVVREIPTFIGAFTRWTIDEFPVGGILNLYFFPALIQSEEKVVPKLETHFRENIKNTTKQIENLKPKPITTKKKSGKPSKNKNTVRYIKKSRSKKTK